MSKEDADELVGSWQLAKDNVLVLSETVLVLSETVLVLVIEAAMVGRRARAG